jgi:hypothetical protein
LFEQQGFDSDVDADGWSGPFDYVEDDTVAINAGMYELGAVSGTIWNDADADGVLDGTEAGRAGVTARLLDADDLEVANTTTNSAGEYEFTALLPGVYKVKVDRPTGTVASRPYEGDDMDTDSEFDPVSDETALFRVLSSESIGNVNGGYAELSTLSGVAFRDDDMDGERDSGEPAMTEVSVRVYDEWGDLVAARTTDSQGSYTVSVAPGYGYSIEFGDDGSHVPTLCVSEPEMSFFTTDWWTPIFTPTPGETVTTDAGLIAAAEVSGHVSESGFDAGVSYTIDLADALVVLTDAAGDYVDSTLTTANGTYEFTVMPGQNYTVSYVDREGFLTPTADVVSTTAGQTATADGEYWELVELESAVVNGGDAALAGEQRSMVKSVMLEFDRPVTLGPAAASVALSDLGGGVFAGAVPETLIILPIDPDTGGYAASWKVEFSGASVEYGSIADGAYVLTVLGSQAIDAAGLGMAGNAALSFTRFYGDINGDASTDFSDYLAFSAALGSSEGDAAFVAGFDANGDATIDHSDTLALSSRYNLSVGHEPDATPAALPPFVNGLTGELYGDQRSRVTSLILTFDRAVALSAGALTVTGTAVNGAPIANLPAITMTALNADANGRASLWLATFSGAGVVAGSLADGTYEFTLNADLVADAAESHLEDDTVFSLGRLFGDVTGDGAVDSADETLFDSTFGLSAGDAGYRAAFDYNGDGIIDSVDEAAFQTRLGLSL